MKSVVITGILKGQRMLSEPHCRSITIHTNELIPEQKEPLEALHGQFVKVLLSPDEISNEMKKAIEETKIEPDAKTPSQRLRSILFVYWKQKGKGEDFDTFYARKIESLIDTIKSKLDES